LLSLRRVASRQSGQLEGEFRGKEDASESLSTKRGLHIRFARRIAAGRLPAKDEPIAVVLEYIVTTGSGGLHVATSSSFATLARFLGCIGAMACVPLAACSSSSKDVSASYVSPTQYAGYSCDQINMERQSVSRRAAELAGQLDNNAQTDKMVVGASALFLFPVGLFFVGGTGDQEAEYGRIKGEVQALESAAVQKNCFTQAASISR
jgi:hypothetical protein